MTNDRAMEVVFLTGFSVGCFRSVPAVAQMADDLSMRLTLLHAFDPRRGSQSAADARLASFFAEADRFAGTRRVALPGTAEEVLRAYSRHHRVDLVVAPGVDRLRPLRLGRSHRAALIEASAAPVWTIGVNASAAGLRRPLRRVACWLDPAASDLAYLLTAAELAHKVGGELHVLHVRPEVSEGEVSLPDGPLHADDVAEVVARELGPGRVAGVHVSPGGWHGAVLDLVKGCDPDLLVLSPRRSVRQRLLGARVGSIVDRVACPVVCMGTGAKAPVVLGARAMTEAWA